MEPPQCCKGVRTRDAAMRNMGRSTEEGTSLRCRSDASQRLINHHADVEVRQWHTDTSSWEVEFKKAMSKPLDLVLLEIYERRLL